MDSQLETMYTVEEVAERARRTPKAIRQLRARNRGPRFRRIDGRLLCAESDLAGWLAGNEAEPTEN